ncbi:hypothetical protein CKO25_09750 [Thiocapsa imhoffii]|uniref:Urease accessory protein UreH-like transmembrane domain-containing protein n=1 Tax=Thiocapsa imhoffii TaxID=382777 RepID=A0A9X1B8H7_9GAMM|nr:sulfite exporter TauE/SafE family protein [Thiocapsa imhoffii]MBK1644929.1 hypothetical protein [Thiocapsa imhoffii]
MGPAHALAFLVGLLSAVHCLGMCTGVVGALSYSLPATMRQRPRRLVTMVLAFNLGRIGSYTLAGALWGSLGVILLLTGAHPWFFGTMRWVAAMIMVGIGLHVAGWFPRFALIERVGGPLWARLEPLGRRLLPVRTLPRAMLLGMIWGWLPCGLVYSMLLSTPVHTGILASALYMGCFGAGTLPTLAAAGVFAGRLYRVGQDRRFQAVAGVGVILLALMTLLFEI